MKALVQRVRRGSVSVSGETLADIGAGIVILLGVGENDSEAEASWLAAKCANLRIFEDEQGKMNRSLLEAGGEALVISQFTLYGNVSKGRRPSFIHAADPEIAEPLMRFAHRLQSPIVVDGELVAVDDVGQPLGFQHLQGRLHAGLLCCGSP